ncbi:hypothetical protein HK102_010019, partial [Quaeritorhiza haematococci]
LPPQHGRRRRPRARGRGGAARLLLDPQHASLGRPELPGGQVRPVRRAGRPQLGEVPGARRRPPTRHRLAAGRRPPQPPRPAGPLQAIRRQVRRRPRPGPRRVLRPGLRADGLAAGPAGLRPVARRRPPPRSLRPQLVRPALPARPPSGRGRRPVRHPERRGLGPPRLPLRRLREADALLRGIDRRADPGPRPAGPAGIDPGPRARRVRPDAHGAGDRPRPPHPELLALDGRRRDQGGRHLRRDRRLRIPRGRRQGGDVRPPRHDAAPPGPGPQEADLPLRRPGHAADRRPRRAGHADPRL